MELDENAVICDLAEVYNIYDYRSLPISLVATFVVGLGENSRIKTKARGGKVPLDTELLMAVVDKLSNIIWGLSGGDDKSRPEFIIEKLYDKPQEDNTTADKFISGEEFMKAWKEASNG